MWKAHKLSFYFDGQSFWTLDVTMPDRMYIMLDLWFGSASGTPHDNTPQGKWNSYEIDWVHAWDCPTDAIPTL